MFTQIWYHANCYDGFGAAYAAWKKFGDHSKYVPMQYGQPMPSYHPMESILMVDYSRKREEVEQLARTVEGLLIIDHHETAEAELQGLNYAVFDMSKSGALLTWEHFHEEPAPALIQHISDRDLWQFKLAGTKEVHAGLCTYPFNFKVWDSLDVDVLKKEGASILRYHQNLGDKLCQEARIVTIAGHKVPLVNVSVLFSEVPSMLLERHPDAPFAAYYYDRGDGMRQYGLRSRGEVNVADIAKQYGGGGHKNAAGFTIPQPETHHPS